MDHGAVTAETLRRLIARGWADMAGVSVYHPEEADRLLRDEVYQAVQLPVSVFDQRFIRSGALERLQKRGIHIFARSVFFQGLFFLDPGSVEDPGLARSALPHIKTLRALAERAGMSVAQFAVTFLRDLPGIRSLVLGADNPEQVLENSALFEAPPLEGSLRQEAETAFRDIDYPGIMAVLSRPRE
jgi:aryl-alcohol dehydrogenase-like predicted oxidoreductase